MNTEQSSLVMSCINNAKVLNKVEKMVVIPVSHNIIIDLIGCSVGVAQLYLKSKRGC